MLWIFALPLIYGYGMAMLAPYHWFFDTHVNFTIQYAIGGVLLGILALLNGAPILTVLLLLIGGLNTYKVYYSYSDPLVFSSPYKDEKPNLTIVQYNKLFPNQRWDEIEKWVKENHEEIDVMLVQESGIHTIYKLKALKKYFPYQFPENPNQRYNDVSVLSRIPFEVEKIPSLGIHGHMPGMKITYQREDMPEPLHLYSIHAQSPASSNKHLERTEDLLIMKQAINADPHPLKLFVGDLNTTPYSQVFQDFKNDTGLKYNDFKWFPNTTWHSNFYFSAFMIPIDHMFYSPAIKQISKDVGPTLGSDHHMLIGKFQLPERTE